MTDLDLQRRLVAKLPEQIEMRSTGISGCKITEKDLVGLAECDWGFAWKDDGYWVCSREWDYIVRMVEEGMTSLTLMIYAEKLVFALRDQETVQPYYEVVGLVLKAPWQQRAQAMVECGII